MDLLFPVTTAILLALGAFCIFISMDNHRKIRHAFRQGMAVSPSRRAYAPNSPNLPGRTPELKRDQEQPA
ncbi:hypothetical protein J2Z22_000470 [Paenibacillus forsythiae]|uniref:DUF3951 domain-containing protein n=1 Tax=Paenibacillus forsythiae TaxID=365616 RepID=A0ABU3H2B3_9BACL|nr:hypothetical protein [Paenibacillus forsythiae]MDT3424957.1 hypothetical protein [Paenibacillus forsythiae]